VSRGRRRTATSNFGVGAREGHDSSPFYDRFRPPQLSDDDRVATPSPIEEPFVCGDARRMAAVADSSVALVVTSPPYFAGKRYEEELEREGVPASYLEYLEMLTDVFAECVRTLEPGGRIAVNVANLGRKPYRSLSADVIRILEHDLGLLLRGELIWQKGEGASGSCAWGSFRSAANPVLRDISERVIVASKGRFDRAKPTRQREAEGLPYASTLTADDFMASTLDVWSIPAESATRVGHPAPFPVALPEQLIRLYTFSDDLVLDPFMGSGSTLVAAAGLGRRYTGYDLDATYVDIARRRVAAVLDAGRVALGVDDDGVTAGRLAERVLTEAGFAIAARDQRVRGSAVSIPFAATDANGEPWWFDVAGPFTSHQGGMLRSEVVWKLLGRAHAIRGVAAGTPLVLLTSHLPRGRSEGDTALRAAGPQAFFDAVELLADNDIERLRRYAKGGFTADPQPGFWTTSDLAERRSPLG
jgi:DNA modification methylase